MIKACLSNISGKYFKSVLLSSYDSLTSSKGVQIYPRPCAIVLAIHMSIHWEQIKGYLTDKSGNRIIMAKEMMYWD